MKKERSSNIELLRIVAMLMIIVYHIWIHCINIQLGSGELYNLPIVYKKLFLFSVISPFGQIGNAIFILISGYFLCSKEKINLFNIAKKLLTQNLFATIALIVGSTILYKLFSSVQFVLVTTDYFNTGSWFIGYYFLVIITASLFLNKFLNKLDKKQYISFLIILFAITQFGWVMGIVTSLAGNLKTYILGIFLYSFGGFIKKFNPFQKIKSSLFIVVFFVTYILTIISCYNFMSTRIEYYYANNATGGMTAAIPSFDNHYLVPIIIAVCIFVLFTRLKIRNNKIINYIGGSTLMIYIMHDNDFIYSLWNTTPWVRLLHSNIGLFFYRYIIWMLLVFYAGLLLYILYNIVSKYTVLVIKKYFITSDKNI